jgi:hypothetical protein
MNSIDFVIKCIDFQVDLAENYQAIYTSGGSGPFVSATSYFGVFRGRGFELPVCSRCRQPGVETAGASATADRSNVVSREVSRTMHRLHDDSAEMDPPAPAWPDFRWRPGFQQFLTLLIAPATTDRVDMVSIPRYGKMKLVNKHHHNCVGINMSTKVAYIP